MARRQDGSLEQRGKRAEKQEWVATREGAGYYKQPVQVLTLRFGSEEEKALVQEAADLEGVSRHAFIVQAALARAGRVLRKNQAYNETETR